MSPLPLILIFALAGAHPTPSGPPEATTPALIDVLLPRVDVGFVASGAHVTWSVFVLFDLQRLWEAEVTP